MLISSLNREMTEKRCFVEIGDRIEKLLPVSECNALSEKRSICVSNLLPKKRIFRPSPERSSPTTTASPHKYDHSASTTPPPATTKTPKPVSAKEERNFDVSIIGEIRINKRGEESFQSVAKATRPSSVATTTTSAAAATTVKLNESSNRNSDNPKRLFQDVDREENYNNSSNSSSCSTIKEQLSPYDFTTTTTASPPESSFTPPPLTIVTFKRDGGDVKRDADVNRNHHPIAKMKQQRVTSKETLTNGNDNSSSCGSGENNSVSKLDIIDKIVVDKKSLTTTTPVEKDERRVAPIIIRAPKLTTCEDDFSVEKRDIIRLPVKFTKVRPSTPSPSSKSSQNNGDHQDSSSSTESVAEKQRSKAPSKQQQQSVEKSKSVASPSKSNVENNVDANAKTSSKKRKRDVTSVDPYHYQNRVGTATRISQELPNCNWLEEKILRAAEAGTRTSSASSAKNATATATTPPPTTTATTTGMSQVSPTLSKKSADPSLKEEHISKTETSKSNSAIASSSDKVKPKVLTSAIKEETLPLHRAASIDRFSPNSSGLGASRLSNAKNKEEKPKDLTNNGGTQNSSGGPLVKSAPKNDGNSPVQKIVPSASPSPNGSEKARLINSVRGEDAPLLQRAHLSSFNSHQYMSSSVRKNDECQSDLRIQPQDLSPTSKLVLNDVKNDERNQRGQSIDLTTRSVSRESGKEEESFSTTKVHLQNFSPTSSGISRSLSANGGNEGTFFQQKTHLRDFSPPAHVINPNRLMLSKDRGESPTGGQAGLLSLHGSSLSGRYEFMSKNLCKRLEPPDQPSLGPSEPPIRHDLFDIDRKRKLLLDEVETIKRMKMEQIEEVESIKKLKLEHIEEVESIKRIKNQEMEEIESIKRMRIREMEETELAKQQKLKQTEEVAKLCQLKETALKEISVFEERIENQKLFIKQLDNELKGKLQQFHHPQQQQLHHQHALALQKQKQLQQQQLAMQQQSQQHSELPLSLVTQQQQQQQQSRFPQPVSTASESKQSSADSFRGYPPNSLHSLMSSATGTSPVDLEKNLRAQLYAQKQQQQAAQQAAIQRTSPAYAFGPAARIEQAARLTSPSRSSSGGSATGSVPGSKTNNQHDSLQHAVTAFHQHQLQQQQHLQQQQQQQQQHLPVSSPSAKFATPSAPIVSVNGATPASHLPGGSEHASQGSGARWFGDQDYRMFHQQQQQQLYQLQQQQLRRQQQIVASQSQAAQIQASSGGRDPFPGAMTQPATAVNRAAVAPISNSALAGKYPSATWRQHEQAQGTQQQQQQQLLQQQQQMAKMAQMAAAAAALAASADKPMAQQSALRSPATAVAQYGLEAEHARSIAVIPANNQSLSATQHQKQQPQQQQQQQSPFGSDVRCKACQKEANFMCSACRGAHYCSLECQRQHWLEHSKSCMPR